MRTANSTVIRGNWVAPARPAAMPKAKPSWASPPSSSRLPLPNRAPMAKAGSISPPGTPAPRANTGPAIRAPISNSQPTRSAGDPGTGIGLSLASIWAIRASPSPPLRPPLNRAMPARRPPRATPQARGLALTRGRNQAVASSSRRANPAPRAPAPSPRGTASINCNHSLWLDWMEARMKIGVPVRLLIKAAREHTTAEGHSTCA